MSRLSNREKILTEGLKVVHAQGFANASVRDIVHAAGVPQGSFTNHFRSKEAFGVQVLDRYAARLDAIMRDTLDNDRLAPEERLSSYFDRIAAAAAEARWQRGCIVPDLAAEIAAHGDALREHLCAVLARQSARFEAVARLLRPDDAKGAADLGAFLLAAWHGTLLRMKVERNGDAIDRFRRVLASLARPAERVD